VCQVAINAWEFFGLTVQTHAPNARPEERFGGLNGNESSVRRDLYQAIRGISRENENDRSFSVF
jgi:hypothetical protein